MDFCGGFKFRVYFPSSGRQFGKNDSWQAGGCATGCVLFYKGVDLLSHPIIEIIRLLKALKLSVAVTAP